MELSLLGWILIGVCCWAAALVGVLLLANYKDEIRELDLDIATKTMWHERIWTTDNERD